MLVRTLPGLVVALVLGIAFCLHGEGRDGKADAGAGQKWRVESARTQPLSAEAPVFSKTERRKSLSGEAVAFVPREAALPAPVPAMAASPVRREVFTEITHPEQVAEVAAATARRVSSGTGSGVTGDILSSASAFASMNAFCEAETSAWVPTAQYPDQPIRGLEVWTSAMNYQSKQDMRQFETVTNNIYSHDGTVYSLGVRQDWSVDSVVGMSVDILDAEVKGRYDFDYRKNEITGYLANALYQGTFLGRYPVELKGTYGRLYHEGSGEFKDPGTGMETPWTEERHRSHYYGFSAKAGVPLLFGGVVKVLPEFGMEYRQVRTSEFIVDASANGSERYLFDAMKSKSLMLPLSVTVKRDYKQCWGLVTPRVKVGYARELEESATGVRALNSTAASRPHYNMWEYYVDENSTALKRPVYDPSQKDFWEFEAGLDIRTVGGWNVSAEYRREWAKKYTRDEFKLELGRCF